MSGGPYGRGKAPERACKPVSHWPTQDRALWLRATEGDHIFGDGGDRADHRPASNRKTEQDYGRWLTFLDYSGQLDLESELAVRITSERVKAYCAHMVGLGNKPQTLLGRLQGLGEIARLAGPERDWTFINRIASRIRGRHKPARDKRAILAPSQNLLQLGLQLMDSASSASTPRRAATAYRDGLVITFLALMPLRRRNLAELALGETLVDVDGTWVLILPGEITKTHVPKEDLWPEMLVPYLNYYLTVHRPYLASLTGRWAKPIGNALWVSTDGSPMTQMAIYDRIRARTEEAFGFAINPHAFRHAAATTLAIEDPEHVRAASTILGHRSSATTQRYYQLAGSLEAGRQFATTLDRRRR